MTLLEDISSAVQRGKKKEVKPLVQQAIDEGMDPQVILNEGLVPAMSIIGDKFSAGEVFVPEMLHRASSPAPCGRRRRASWQSGHRHSSGRHARHR